MFVFTVADYLSTRMMFVLKKLLGKLSIILVRVLHWFMMFARLKTFAKVLRK